MRHIFVTLFFLACMISTAQLPGPEIIWQQCFGGSAEDLLNDMKPTSDGGFIMVGSTRSNDGQVTGHQGEADVWIVKVDEEGSLEWEKTYGGSGNDNGRVVVTTLDGGYLIAANTTSTNGDISEAFGEFDIWVLKLSMNGEMEWQRSYGGSGTDSPYDLVETVEGYLIIGETTSSDGMISNNYGYNDIWLIKINNENELLWESTYGSPQGDLGTSLAVTDEAIFIVGSVNGSPYDGYVAKLDVNGNVIWENAYGGSDLDGLYSVEVLPDETIISPGFTYSNDGDILVQHGLSDSWLLKLDINGELIWSKTYGGSDHDGTPGLNFIDDGGFLLSGFSRSADGDLTGNSGNGDAWMVRLNQTGEILWQQNFGGTSWETTDVSVLSEGQIICAGSTLSNDLDVSGNHGNMDFWLMKLERDPVGIIDQAPSTLVHAYPNPTLDNITITINIQYSQQMKMEIMDSVGRRSTIGVAEMTSSGQSNIDLDLSNYTPGTYQILLRGNTSVLRFQIVKM